MNTYILTLLAASLTAAVTELLAPKGEGGRLASHIRMIAGLFLLVTLLNPLKAGLELLRDAADGGLSDRLEAMLPDRPAQDADGYKTVLGDSLAGISQREVEAFAVSVLEAEFGIPPEGCIVAALCAFDADTLTLTELRIALRDSYALRDPHPIESYFTDTLGCPCFVTVG